VSHSFIIFNFNEINPTLFSTRPAGAYAGATSLAEPV
jgi:hypothetical protein